MEFDVQSVTACLRAAGARFALIHGSRADDTAREASDLDIAAWWGSGAPDSWEVPVPSGVDLIVLDHAPLWLAGRIALRGRILFDDDPRARVSWQADTRTIYLDEQPQMQQTYREYLEAVAHGR